MLDDDARADLGLDEIVREGAKRMLAMALDAEVDAYLDRFSAGRDDQGRRLVVRNGRSTPVRHEKGRGMRAPVVAVGDGGLGMWAALREVFLGYEVPALLGAQGRKLPERPAEVGSVGNPQGPGRDP